MNWLKATGLSIGAIILGSVLAMQAVTNVFDNDQPALAASASSLNGNALEYLAMGQLAAAGANGEAVPKTAKSLKPLVERILRKEPLMPNALTILALAQEDPAKKAEILLATAQINRRPLMLQSNLLTYYSSRNDIPNSIATLDNMLAVHPEQSEILFPALIGALKDARSISPIARVLQKQPRWGSAFMKAAARDVDSVDNIARVRMNLLNEIPDDRDVDRVIVDGLVKAGKVDMAAALYQDISNVVAAKHSVRLGGYGKLDWGAQLPPFDWRLYDDPGARAQIIEKPERMEFFVKSGKAGIMADRLIFAPEKPFVLEILHDVKPVDQLEDVRIQIQCEKTKEKLTDLPFTKSPSRYLVPTRSKDCGMINISIKARAWSDKLDLQGEIYSVSIIPYPVTSDRTPR
jgi:hypothetical protein